MYGLGAEGDLVAGWERCKVTAGCRVGMRRVRSHPCGAVDGPIVVQRRQLSLLLARKRAFRGRLR
jgi:hypothetical protein